ncbi:hypothetical protein MTO96_024461 [Rhipicephalus appendiculatus]
MAAVLEYLTTDVLELVGNVVRNNHKTRITTRHLQLDVRNNEELASCYVASRSPRLACCPTFSANCYQ